MATEWVDIASGNDPRWRHFIHEVPVVPFSWDERFLTICRTVFRYTPHRFLLMEKDQPRVGGVFLSRKRMGKLFATAPFFAFYLPVIATEPSWYRRLNDLTLFLEHLEGHFQSVECVSLPGVPLCLPYLWRGWEVSVQASGLLPISDPQETLQAMESEERRLIRKAQRNPDLKIIRDVPVDAFYQLLQEVYGRHQTRPPFSPRQFRGFVSALQETGLGDVPGVATNGQLQAATVVIPYGNTVYGVVLARHANTTGSLAGLKLIWHVVTTYASAGMEWYDLGGMEIPTIARFKLKLGALPRMVYRCRYLRSKHTRVLHRLATIKNKTLRSLW